jgi:hypothetical protein
VFSIHQPRPEAFALNDNLVLLSRNGEMVYSGASTEAPAFLSRCPGFDSATLSSISQNPADFIIDILGLHNDKDGDHSDTTGITEESMGTDLAMHFRKSREHSSLHRTIVSKLDIPNLSTDKDTDTASNSDNASSATSSFIQSALDSTIFARSHREYARLSAEDGINCEVDASYLNNMTPSSEVSTPEEGSNWRETFVLHLWVLFARRVEVSFLFSTHDTALDVFIYFPDSSIIIIIIIIIS